jgi:hypothetical protein
MEYTPKEEAWRLWEGACPQAQLQDKAAEGGPFNFAGH